MDDSGSRLSTGVPGLDRVLEGGLIPRRAYLIRGGPGFGKTTLGFHFLTAAKDTPALLVTLGEGEAQLRENARRQGFDLANVEFLDLSPSAEFFTDDASYDVFNPADVERKPIADRIVEAVKTHQPVRVFVDSVTQFRYFVPDPFQFRRQVMGFLRFVLGTGATVVLTSESSVEAPDDDVQFAADGIIELKAEARSRFLAVTKFRGSELIRGWHDLRLSSKGVSVFPRLVPGEHAVPFPVECIGSGIPEIDELLSGGIERGTVTVISGPAGAGKTTFGLQFMKEAAGRGERSVVYAFEEKAATLIRRCEGINIPVRPMIEQGKLVIREIEPLIWAPYQFAETVRQEIEQGGARIVMLDSISGFSVSIRGEDLAHHLHALCRYLTNMGVTVLLPNETETITGLDLRATDLGISYLADAIILLRYFELRGELRKCVGVLKKRGSDFQKALREFEITRYGLRVGKPLSGMRGILQGAPALVPE